VRHFGRVVALDFEYEVEGGEFGLIRGDLPKVLCMVAYVLEDWPLQHVRTVKLWRGNFPKEPPFPIDDDTLVIGYSLWAEMTIFLTLGWRFPTYLFDLHTAYLAASNILREYNPDTTYAKLSKNFAAACRHYGLEGWEGISKEEIAAGIGTGQWQKYGQEAVFRYCEEDVAMSVRLFEAELAGRGHYLPASDFALNLHWANYSAKAIAQIQAKGMPIDTELWNLIQQPDIKKAIIADLLRRFDPSHHLGKDAIYDEDGGWNYGRFEKFLTLSGVDTWPRSESGVLETDKDAFKLMVHVPGMADLHTLKDSLNVIVKANLPIGRDGRNRPSLFPFGTATGRNAHGKSLFNAHAAMRGFLMFSTALPGFYLDWSSQEVGIGASLSRDLALMTAYMSGDIYYAFAKEIGLTDGLTQKEWKATREKDRDRIKALYLAITYGMSVASLARSLDRHPLIASGLIQRHQHRYPRFWTWRDERLQAAMHDRIIETRHRWPLRISSSPNERTLINFSSQGNGSECLRIAAMQLCEAGIVPSMLVHDAILLEEHDRERVQEAKEIMLAAGREVCGGFTIRVDGDEKPIRRYQDKRGKEMWARMMMTLQEVGALNAGPAALLKVGVAEEMLR
jgi:hypothetical protein